MATAKLIIKQNGERSRCVEVSTPVVSIGRRQDNTVCLEDSNVSKYHAVIERRGDAYFITDLGSSNGTTVNGEPLDMQRPLQDEDLVCVGGVSTIQFHLDVEQGAAATPPAPAEARPSGLPSAPSMPAGLHAPSTPDLRMPHAPNVPTPNVRAPNLNAPSVNVPGVHAPSVNVPSVNVPGVNVPGVNVPNVHVPGVQTPAVVQKILGMPRAIFAGLAGTLGVGVIVAALWGAGVIGGAGAAAKRADADPLQEQLDEATGSSAKPKGEAADSPSGSSSDSSHEDAPLVATTAPAAPAPVAPAASADATASLARTLAGQISQKSSYTFDPHFVDYIKMYLNEYKSAPNYYERAGKYRDAIDREFVNTQGIQPPLVPYLLAMSQTKFVERGSGGVWNLPPSVLRGYAGQADPNDPAAATRAAAAYTRALLDVFDKEDFMYAVACYGMSVDEAGKVRLALESKDPGGQSRGDFWKMKSAGVVQGEQVQRVARFFAAGIVCENPSQFGLKEKPLSSLY